MEAMKDKFADYGFLKMGLQGIPTVGTDYHEQVRALRQHK